MIKRGGKLAMSNFIETKENGMNKMDHTNQTHSHALQIHETNVSFPLNNNLFILKQISTRLKHSRCFNISIISYEIRCI